MKVMLLHIITFRSCTVLLLCFMLFCCSKAAEEASQPDIMNDITNNEIDTNAELILTLTTTPSIFSRYFIAIDAIKAIDTQDSVYDLLPSRISYDLTLVSSENELLSRTVLPAGEIKQIVVSIDFTESNIITRSNSVSETITSILDVNGNVLSNYDHIINLESGIALKAGGKGLAAIEINLRDSHEISVDGSGVMVIDPIMSIKRSVNNRKSINVRGILAEIDYIHASLQYDVRPLYVSLLEQDENYGLGNSVVPDSAVLFVDNTVYSFSEVFAQTGLLSSRVPFTLKGYMETTTFNIVPEEIYIDAKNPNMSQIAVRGNVASRAGSTIDLVDVTLFRPNGVSEFRGVVQVNVGDGPPVFREGALSTILADQQISIGQQVQVFGGLINEDQINVSINANLIFLRKTTLSGAVLGKLPGQTILLLDRIDDNDIRSFDFSATGPQAGQNSDPQNYTVNTGGLDVGPYDIGGRIYVRGFTNPFGDNETSDFIAVDVFDF